jgi:hypothetical protein
MGDHKIKIMNNSPSQSSIQQIVKSQLVEISIPTANTTLTQFKFPTQDFLRGKYIISIESLNVHDVPVSPIGNAVITYVNMQNSFLTLYEQNPEATDAQGITSSGEGQWNENIPLVTLHRLQNASTDAYTSELPIFTPRVIVWEKSYVQLANGTTLGNGAAVSFLFQVGYIGNAGDNN